MFTPLPRRVHVRGTRGDPAGRPDGGVHERVQRHASDKHEWTFAAPCVRDAPVLINMPRLNRIY